jgi:hypothetical protein
MPPSFTTDRPGRSGTTGPRHAAREDEDLAGPPADQHRVGQPDDRRQAAPTTDPHSAAPATDPHRVAPTDDPRRGGPLDKHAGEAVELERAAHRTGGHPDGPLLIEAANQWHLAGNLDRCRALLAVVIDQGGTPGCYARAELIAILLELGAFRSARAELARLAADPALDDGACQLVAELLTDHGSLDRALDWYDRAIARWDDHRRAAATGQPGRRPTEDQLLVQQRNRIDRRLTDGRSRA